MLISFVVTAKLICVFVFAYAKSQFSHDAAHISFILGSGVILSFLLCSFLCRDKKQTQSIVLKTENNKVYSLKIY